MSAYFGVNRFDLVSTGSDVESHVTKFCVHGFRRTAGPICTKFDIQDDTTTAQGRKEFVVVPMTESRSNRDFRFWRFSHGRKSIGRKCRRDFIFIWYIVL
jgi:hypothetical protein